MIRTNKFDNAPSQPGIYFFKKGRLILYIGKAANLRVRLRSYARSHDLDPAKRAMVAEATSLSFEETINDIEALLKEAQLIKRYRPKYNVLLRDDKNYSFVGFTKERFPKVFVTHQPTVSLRPRNRGGSNPVASAFSSGLPHRYAPRNDNLHSIGPFTDGAALKKTLHLLRRIFPYCVCKQLHKRPCQYAQMGLCIKWCCTKNGNVKFSAIAKNIVFYPYRIYKKNIAAIHAILSGRRVDIVRKLQKEMRARSRAKRFEEAVTIRDQIAALKRVFAHRPFLRNDMQTDHEKGLRLLQTVAKLPSFPHRIEAYDISHYQGKESVGSMVVFEDGLPAKSQYRKFIIRHVSGINDPAMIHDVLTRRLRHAEWPIPNFILIDGGKPQLNAALLSLRGSPPWRGDEAIPLYPTGLPRSPAAARSLAMTRQIGALAKREEELYLLGKKPLALKTMPPPLLHLLQHLRNEAHRFAISFSKHRFRKQQTV